MTGLIWKDFLVMRKGMKSYLLMIAIYVVLAWLGVFNYSFVTTFIQVMLMVLPITAFVYDEQAKWDRYAMSLPLGRGKVVGARYLFVLILTLCTMSAGLAGIVLIHLLQQEELTEMLLTLAVSSAMGILVPAVILPLSYKLGAERARPFLYAIIFIPVIAFVVLGKLKLLDFSGLKRLEALPPSTVAGGAFLLPLGALALLAVSYLISCRVAAGKEY